MKKKVINWGIISSAKIGWEHVIPAIIKSKNSNLLAIASRSKIKAIKAYKNEIREFPHPRSIEALDVITKRWGSVSGFNHAEAFKLVRTLIK